MDGPWVCHSEVRQKEKTKYCILKDACTWNLEKLYWWTSLQGRDRDAAVENRLVDTGGEGVGGMDRDLSTDIYTLPRKIDNG